MALAPYDDGAFLRQVGSSGHLARRSPTRPQRWIQDEAAIQRDEINAAAKVVKRVMELEGEIALHQHSVFRQAAETMGAELDDARA